MPRKINSKSLDNLIAGRNKSKRQRKQIKIMPEAVNTLKLVGAGSLSDGIDKLAERVPIFSRVKAYLHVRAAAGDKQAEILLDDLETLGIEACYEDAITDGAISPRYGAWIV